MNKKTKVKSWMVLSLFTLLFSLLILGCNSHLDDNDAPARVEGYGRVAVNIDGAVNARLSRARTAYPTIPEQENGIFEYKYVFNNVVKEYMDREVTRETDGTFILPEADNWTVTVKLYAGDKDDENNFFTSGTSGSFTIDAATPVNISVQLEDVITSTGTGTFKYSVTFPASSAIDEFSLVNIGNDTGVVLAPNVVIDGQTYTIAYNTNSQTLMDIASGYYLFTVNLSLSDGSENGFIEVIHIYDNLPTEFEKVLSSGDFVVPLGTAVIDVSEPNYTGANNAVTRSNIEAAYNAVKNDYDIVKFVGTRDWGWTATFSIPANKTVLWNANVSGGVSTQTLIDLTGVGTFNVTGSVIASGSNNRPAITNSSTGTVIVSGNGTVTSAGNEAAIYNNVGGVITVAGGTVSSASTAIRNEAGGTINIEGGKVTGATTSATQGTIRNAATGTINISGGVVENTAAASNADRMAIHNVASGGKVNVAGGTVQLTNLANPNTIMSPIRSNGGTVSIDFDNATIIPWIVPSLQYEPIGNPVNAYRVIGIGTYDLTANNGVVAIPDTWDDGTNGELPVAEIGANAFANKIAITSVSIGENVTTIGQAAFYGNVAITSIVIPNNVTTIGSSAFGFANADNGRTNITLGNGLISIGANTFQYNSGVTSITIPENVTTIGSNVFLGCSNLTNITINTDKVTTFKGAAITQNVFGAGGWHDIFPASGLNVTFNAEVGQYALAFNPASSTKIASVTLNEGITAIGHQAFLNNTGITSVTIPNTVTIIESEAFRGSSALTTISVGSGVTTIGNNAFQSCTNLKNITLNNSNAVTYNGAAFSSTNRWINVFPNVTNVTINSNIGQVWAFFNNTTITTLTIGRNVTALTSESAFRQSTNLTSVTFEAGIQLQSIGAGAFMDCSKLASITIPNTVTSLSGFMGCSLLNNIVIPASVQTIAQNSFHNAAALTSVTFETAGIEIGETAFPLGASPGAGNNNLRTAYTTGGAGTYTRATNGNTWTRVPDYDISLSGTLSFTAITFGAAQPNWQTITITNTGLNPTAALTISSGNSYFEVSPTSVATIAAGGTATFNVRPIANIPSGNNNATITVAKAASNPNAITSKTVSASITVNNSPSTVTTSSLNGVWNSGIWRLTFSGNNVELVSTDNGTTWTFTYTLSGTNTINLSRSGSNWNGGIISIGNNKLTFQNSYSDFHRVWSR